LSSTEKYSIVRFPSCLYWNVEGLQLTTKRGQVQVGFAAGGRAERQGTQLVLSRS